MKKFMGLILIILMFLVSVDVYALNRENAEFSACVDGDTAKLIMDDEVIKVRFLAVDTPESVHPTVGEEEYGKDASEYTCKRLKEAKKITVEYDPKSDKKDKYDRHLVWLYVDDSLLQKELISRGYAEVAYLYGDYLYTDDLQREQVKAKRNKLGIWSLDEKNTSSEEFNQPEYEGLIDEICEILKKIGEMLVDFIIDML